MVPKSKKRDYKAHLLIVCVNILVWFPSLFVRLLNDDFHIILWIEPGSFWECFKPLWTPYVVDVYWRPLTAIVNTLAVYFAGSAGYFVFHLLSLITYIAASMFLYRFLLLLKVSKEGSVLFTLLFSVLPAHEMAVAWLAARNDTLALIFILITLSYFIKHIDRMEFKQRAVFILMMVAAFLCKEASYPMILIFPAYRVLFHHDRLRSLKAYKELIVGIILILSIIILRWLIIGGGLLFETPNLGSASFGNMLFNLVAYLPLSFISSDALEQIFTLIVNNIAVSTIIATIVVTGIIILVRKTKITTGRIAIFGLLWFLVFIVTALPMLGRWYTYIPSVGLIITVAALYDSIKLNQLRRIIVIVLIVGSGYLSFTKMLDWIQVSEKSEVLYQSLKEYNFEGVNSITILAAPNKIDNVNSMRTGVHQLVNYFTDSGPADIGYPLKTETYGDCQITLDSAYEGSLTFKATNGRFLLPGSKSGSRLIDENRQYSDDNIEITVENHSDGVSRASVKFLRPPILPRIILYYDGAIFRQVADSLLKLN